MFCTLIYTWDKAYKTIVVKHQNRNPNTVSTIASALECNQQQQPTLAKHVNALHHTHAMKGITFCFQLPTCMCFPIDPWRCNSSTYKITLQKRICWAIGICLKLNDTKEYNALYHFNIRIKWKVNGKHLLWRHKYLVH